MKTTAELIAEFKARGGQTTVIPAGETAVDLTPSGWAKAIREPGKVMTKADTEAAHEHLSYARHELAQQAHWSGDHEFGHEVSNGKHDRMLKKG